MGGVKTNARELCIQEALMCIALASLRSMFVLLTIVAAGRGFGFFVLNRTLLLNLVTVGYCRKGGKGHCSLALTGESRVRDG